MVEMNNLASPQLVEAVRLWTGWQQRIMPCRDDKRLVECYGQSVAAELLAVISSLESDFYSSDARLVAADLHEMARLASEQFQRKHPTVADEIVRAFAWCYTFDFK